MSEERPGYSQTPLGESEVFLNFQQELSRAALVNRSVLLIGERGSGKELAALRLHYLSPRWQNNLVTVNCAALPPSLIESELFGYEAGAFTGAGKARKGRFEEAQGGTLFLDEIGLIPLEVQEKILRVVEYGTFERLGSSITHEVDVRIVGATNTNLLDLVEEGKFKRDLLDRLSFEVLFLPPLRERGEDIILLAEYFAAKMAHECNLKQTPFFSETLKEKLRSYPWPGNVRELKNVIERSVYRSEEQEINEVIFNPFKNPYQAHQESLKRNRLDELSRYSEAKEELDRSFLIRALKKSGGNQKEAARLLGLTYDQFRGLYRKYKGEIENS
ncbi:MAG: sigma 54-interacting transcriptional regulator [Sphaerochaetaceae bacterium]